MRIVVAITGASGAVYGVRILDLLRGRPDVEVHLVVTRAGMMTLRHECGLTPAAVRDLAAVVHPPGDIGATIASGSYPVHGMLVAPCSVKTLSAIAYCHADDLVSRAADVCLKEGRPLLLMVRETPLHLGHLRAMTAAAEAGAIIAPPVPAFYAGPSSVDELVDHTARRALARIGLSGLAPAEWAGEIGRATEADPAVVAPARRTLR
ncbi:UbiX family flavin prenyltransferase [Amycolatopsis thermophila]|uniref:Flavin prenyltransferase UbiX n=1 Tax=Amycolatopsis thermophila TaxID=206084 RepID=A0ABU0EYX1_9PSEU|nr:UbiX family flavin prenyltransferase [Amycolatopsis thermophila]MDQ0380471.1 4-hydroxy-3-polyprenylbenzoate decarboxylase [Amycolatopsis thermophila]